MLSFIEDRNCTGCSACKAVCPQKCITMRLFDDGFLYPEVDESRCIHCNACESICPQKGAEKKAIEKGNLTKEAYAAINYDYEVWKKSTSGGAFSAICNAWDNENTYFIGAVWEGLVVKHNCVNCIEDIDIFRKSKYISSDMNGMYEKAKELLQNNNRVVFSGTPCQIAGLKAYLKRDYSGLLLIDLICHGVGSRYVFEECLNEMEEQLDAKIISYSFREKRNIYEMDYLSKVTYVTTTGKKKELYIEKDRFNQLFLKQLCLRKSCGKNCKYRDSNREGDITIADFKGLGNVFPDLAGSKYNYSTIVVNTEKGQSIVDKLKTNMQLRKCDVSAVEKYNPLFGHQTWFAEDRDEFFELFKNDARSAICANSTPFTEYKSSLKRIIYNNLPVFIRNTLQRRIIL